MENVSSIVANNLYLVPGLIVAGVVIGVALVNWGIDALLG